VVTHTAHTDSARNLDLGMKTAPIAGSVACRASLLKSRSFQSWWEELCGRPRDSTRLCFWGEGTVGRERRGHYYARDAKGLPIFRLLRLGVYFGGWEMGNQPRRS
jgi:hypothetical protein